MKLQSDRLKKSDKEIRASSTKLEEAEVCLREQESALKASAEELATARRDYASSTDESTQQIDRLLLFVKQLKQSVADASHESEQKQNEHLSIVSALEKQMAQLRLARSSAEEQRASATEELDSLRRELDVLRTSPTGATSQPRPPASRPARQNARKCEKRHRPSMPRLLAECKRLQMAGVQDRDNNCPAELAATRESLRLAEESASRLRMECTRCER